MIEIIKLELKKNLKRLFAAIIVIFLIFTIVLIQVGISKYRIEINQKPEFIEVEKRKVQSYINYMQLGGYGFRRLLESSPLISMFYNSTTLGDLQAFIESGVRLQFNKPEIGKNLFDRPTGGTLDFSWYLTVIGGVIVLAWGFFSLRNREQNRYFMNYTTAAKVYWGIIIARTLLIITVLAITTGVVFIQLLLNGIALTTAEIWGLLVFFLVSVIVLVFLLVVSSGIGAIKNWITGGILTVAFGLTFILLWPEILNVAFSSKAAATMKSKYKHEIQKTELLMEVEHEALKHTGRYEEVPDKIEADRRSAEHYWNNIYDKVAKLNFEMVEMVEEIAREFHFYSIFNPVTFYKAVNNELSSKGYKTYSKFYRENQDIQKGFLRYIFDKRFYENYSKVQAYLPEEKTIVKAVPGLPSYFGFGLLVNILYIVGGLFFSYSRFIRRLYPHPVRAHAFKNIELRLRKGICITINSHVQDFILQFYNVLAGKCKKFIGKIFLEGENIVNNKKKDFVYLPNPDKIYGWIKTGSFITMIGRLLKLPVEKVRDFKAGLGQEELNKRVDDLGKLLKARLLFKLAQLKGAGIFIFHDFFNDLHQLHKTDIKSDINELKNQGVLIIDMLSHHGSNLESSFNASIREGEDGYDIDFLGDYQ